MSQVELKTHYSAAELAAMKLPSMPGTIQGIGIRAKTEQWESQKRQGRGGGYEYAFTSLPDAAVRAIKDRLVKSMVAAPVVSVPALPMKAAQMELALTSRQQTVEGARKGVLVAIERLMAGCGVSREAAIHTLLTQAKAGTLDPHLERMLCAAHDGRGRKGDSPYPSVRSIKGWRALEKQGQLAPKTAVSTVLEIPAWAKSFLTYWQLPSKPSVAHAYEQFQRDWTDKAEDIPSVHQVRRFIGKLGAVSREVGRIGPREMKNIKPFIRRDISQLQPNDVWTADGHTFDAEVQHPMHGRPFRPEITAIIDVATRRIIGWSVGLAESGLAVLDAITHAVTREGVMAIFYVDNGSGYKNDMLRNESTGIMGRLGAEMKFARPYNSQAKGAVERLHKSVFVRAARELQSYIGTDMDREAKLSQFKLTRKAIKDGGSVNLISWPHFIEFINQRIADYNARPHSSLNGISPDMKLAEFVAMGWEPTRLQPGEEAYLFRPQVERTISRCEISVFGNRYFSRDLEEFHGERLRIGYDVNNARLVWVYADDGRLICTAEWNANVRSYFPVSVIEQARDRRAAGRADRLQVHLEEVQAERRGQPAIEAQQEIVIPGLISGTREQLAEAAALARAKCQPQTMEAPALRMIDVEPITASWWTCMCTAAPTRSPRTTCGWRQLMAPPRSRQRCPVAALLCRKPRPTCTHWHGRTTTHTRRPAWSSCRKSTTPRWPSMAKPILTRVLVGAGIVDDGISALQIAGAERFVAMSTPSAPASGSLLLYGKTVAGRTQLHVMPDASGEYALQSAFWKKTIGMATAYYNGTSLSYFGMGTGTTIGTNTARSYATTTLASRSLRWGNVSAATAGALCGFYFTTSWMIMGDGSTTGRGFYWQGRFSVSDAATVSGARMFAGLTSSTSAPTNVEPNTLTNCVGLAQLSTDSTQLYLVYGGATAQTAVPLGTNFPVQETPGSAAGGALYDLHIYSDPAKNGQITVQVDRVGTTYSFTQTIASSGSAAILPAAGTRMGPTMWRTNNATALAVGIDVNRFYHELEL